MARWFVIAVLLLAVLSACSLDTLDTGSGGGGGSAGGDLYRVVNVIDGDTIDVERDGETYRVRYVGVNTPERDEPCYQDAKDRNRQLVMGKDVRLTLDTSDTDRYDRLLRLVYVDNTFVNQTLVSEGWAEAVLYMPDDANFDNFSRLEREAARAGRGCHATGIFDDGNDER